MDTKKVDYGQIADSILLKALLENMPVFIYFKDRKGRHIKVSKALKHDYYENYCKLYDMERSDIIGKTDLDMYSYGFAEQTYAEDMRVMETGKPIIEKIEGGEDLGQIKYYLTTKVPIFNDEDEVIGLAGITYEITEQKKAEMKLENVNESLKIINRILRHDILNNLTASRGYLSLYRLKKNVSLLDCIENSIDKSIDLIKQMKSLEHIVINFEAFDVFDLRKEIEEKVQSQTIPDNMEINVKGEAKVFADVALRSIIDNLIHNALIHAETNRLDFIIEDKKDDDICILLVKDFGKGIPDRVKNRIFEPGFKYGDAGQSGFGLYIVSKIMERYEGKIRVEDNEPNGTTFILSFKCARELDE